jgi:hypothetical protein
MGGGYLRASAHPQFQFQFRFGEAKRQMQLLDRGAGSASNVDGLWQHRTSDVRTKRKIPARISALAVASPNMHSAFQRAAADSGIYEMSSSLAIERQAALVILPASEVDGAFFQLKTGVAGDLIQKFVNYLLRLAIIGDVAADAERSVALRAFTSESNRGRTLWFSPALVDLRARLALERTEAAPRMRHFQTCG